MAFLHPKNLASRSDVPERLQVVARCLRDFLPDDVTVWLERTGDGDAASAQLEFDGTRRSDTGDVEAYLVLLDPQAGILVIEAPTRSRMRSSRRDADPKGPSGLSALAGAFRNRLGLGRNDKTSADDDAGAADGPVMQDRIRSMISERVSQLRRDVDRDSISDLPVAKALALPRMRAGEAANLSERLGVPVLAAEDFTSEALRPALRRAIGGRSRQPLTRSEEDAVRATVNPAIVIDGGASQMFTAPGPSGEHLLRVLDREQERLARNLGSGYRLIRGVAGSGKTLVITHRAMHMSSLLPDWRILVLCFNKPLKGALAKELSECGNVTVANLDALAYKTVGGTESGEAGQGIDFDRQRRDAVEIARRMDDSQRYDMVLVDEAQDLDSVGLDLAWAMLKPERGHFVMALDSAQAIYRRKMTWNPPGMTARGRSTVLDINYRNTEQVLSLGLQVLLGGEDSTGARSRGTSPSDGHRPGIGKAGSAAPDDFNELVMPDKAVRSGPRPELLACADHRAEVTTIAGKVEQLRSRGVAADDIAVLLGSLRIGSFQMRDEVMRRVPDAFMVEGRQREKAAFVRGRVRVASLGILKGLEFKHVVIGACNHIWVAGRSAGAQSGNLQRRLLYVALTRATESVTVVYSGSGLMSDIGTGGAEVKRVSPDQFKPISSGQAEWPGTGPGSGGPGTRARRTARPAGASAPVDTARPTKTVNAKPYAPLDADAKALYDRLRQWRLERSKTDGVPAYTVFNDKVMTELARRRPVTDEELLKIPGIGPKRLKSYGLDLKKVLGAGR